MNIVGAPVGIAGESFTLSFFSKSRTDQRITEHNKKQKEKA